MRIVLLIASIYLLSAPASPVREKKGNEQNLSASDIPVIYKSLPDTALSYEAFELGVQGFIQLQNEGKLNNDSLLTIIDFNKPSDQQRLFIVDLKNRKIIERSLVAHGKNTGALYAKYFSNSPNSHKSSLGFFITTNAYIGKHGYSLRLNGMEPGINSNAYDRDIVFHKANYVSDDFIKEYGRLGRSFGCPVLPNEKNDEIINLIKDKSCLFIFYPSRDYLNKSSIIRTSLSLPQTAE